MGTLIKEDFGCPNRENTMVSCSYIHELSFVVNSPYVYHVNLLTGHATWII